MQPCGCTRNCMIFIRINMNIVLFSGFIQCCYQIHSILKMHIIIGRTMNKQILSFQFRRIFNQRIVIIPCRIINRFLHVPLCVNGVIIPPIRNGCNGNSHFKNICAIKQTQRRHISTITPSPNTDSCFIHKTPVPYYFCGGNNIFRLQFSQIQVCCFFNIWSAGPGSAGINTKNNISFLCEQLIPHKIGTAIPV